MKAVDEVEVGTGSDAFEERAFRADDIDLVPADLRDLEVGFGGGGLETDDGSLEDPEAERAGIELFTTFEQRLVSDADSEEWPSREDPLAHRLGQFAALQGMDAVVEGPDTGEDEAMGGIEAVGRIQALNLGPGGHQGFFDASDITGAIIEEREHRETGCRCRVRSASL